MRHQLMLLLSILLVGCDSEKEPQANQINDHYEIEDSFSTLDSLTLAVEHIDIPAKTSLTSVMTKEVVSLESLNLDNSLVLYLSEIQCSACISQEMEMLKTHYDHSEVILLCDYRSMRELKLYLLINKIEYPAYMVPPTFPELMRSLTNPTYFKLGRNYRPSSVFFASFTAKEKSTVFHQTMSSLLKH